MAGYGNARNLAKADSLGQFEKQNGKRYRQSFAVVNDIINIAVSTIVVIGAAAMKPVFGEQILQKRCQSRIAICFGRQFLANLLGHLLDLPLIESGIEIRVVEF